MTRKEYFIYFAEILFSYILLFLVEFLVVNYFIKFITDSGSIRLLIYLLFLLAVNPLLTIYLVNTFLDNTNI